MKTKKSLSLAIAMLCVSVMSLAQNQIPPLRVPYRSSPDTIVFSPKCIAVKQNYSYTLYDNRGNCILDKPFHRCYKMSDTHVALVRDDRRYSNMVAIATIDGKLVSDYRFADVTDIVDGFLKYEKGYITAIGEKLYFSHGEHYKDVYIVQDVKDQLYGLLNSKTQKVVAPCKYGGMDSFDKHGNVCTILNSKYGMISYTGKRVLSNIYLTCAIPIDNSTKYYVVYDNYGGAFYIDKNGVRASERAVQKDVEAYERRSNFDY